MSMRFLPHPLLTFILALVWMLLVNAFTAGSLLLGLLLGWAIPLFTLRFWPETVHVQQPVILLKFTLVVLKDIVVANFIVAGLILRGPRPLRPAFVRVPLELKTDLAISLLANTISLTPGTVSSHLAEDRSHLLVHTLDTDDPAALVRTIKQRYEAPLKEVFES